MALTDRERVLKKLKELIKTAHAENYDFVYIPVGSAKTIVRLLEAAKVPITPVPVEQDGQRFFVCRKCGYYIADGSKACATCGQEVKWE